MNKRMLYVAGVVAALFTGGVMAGSIKVWSNGQTLTSSDINGNFAHLHSTMVGGHGGRLVDADVAANAAISSTKLANGSGIARAWGWTTNICGGSTDGGVDDTCALSASFGGPVVTWYSAGLYRITVPAASGATTSMCLAQGTASAAYAVDCSCGWYGNNELIVQCQINGVAANNQFHFVYWGY